MYQHNQFCTDRTNHSFCSFKHLQLQKTGLGDLTPRPAFAAPSARGSFVVGKVSTAEDIRLLHQSISLQPQICVFVFAAGCLCFCVCRYRLVFLCLHVQICVSVFAAASYLRICVSVFAASQCVSVFACVDLCFCVCKCRSEFLCLQVQICVSAIASADLCFCVCRDRPVFGYADADVHFAITEVCSCNSGTVAAAAKYTL